jgi:acyl carrier protein
VDLDSFAPIIARIKEGSLTEPVRVTPDLDIVRDLSFDSLAITEFLYSIEETFSISIPFERLRPEHLRSLGALRNFLLMEATPLHG